MNSSPMAERVLAVAIATLLVVGLVGVATVKDDKSERVGTASATSSTTAGDGGDTGGGTSTTNAPGASTSSTAASAGPSTTKPAVKTTATTSEPVGKDPGPAQPPKLGLYKFDTKKNETQTTTEIRITKDSTQVPGEQRFTLAVKEGESNNSMSDLIAWRADGIYLRMMTFPNPSGGPPFECDWEPDLLDRKLPTKAGQQWDVDSTCHVTFGTAAGTFHLKGHGKVDGARRVTVAGQSIDAWLITQTAHLDIDFVYNGQPIHAENDTTTQDYFSSPRGITVKTIESSTSKDPSGKSSSEKTERVIQSLTPAP